MKWLRLKSDSVASEILVYRRLLLLTAIIYLVWWLAVDLLLPKAFNPIGSRLAVVGTLLVLWGVTPFSKLFQDHIKDVFSVSVWLVTIHYYYLFYNNAADINWIIGCYITVIAINFFLVSQRSLLLYSGLVIFLSVALVALKPQLINTVFLPGLITIVLQANLGLQSRFNILKSLANSNERFRLLFESTFEGILVHRDGVILNVNSSLANLFGCHRNELIGKRVLDLIDPASHEIVLENLDYEGIPYETMAIRSDGIRFEVEVCAKSFKYDDEPARLVTLQKITDRKRIEEERVRLRALAESVRIRDEFISIASHELKTPLTSLKLRAQMMQSREKQEFAFFVDRQTNKLVRLVDTMLDVSRISSGQTALHYTNLDLVEVAKEVVNVLPMTKVKGPKVQLHCPQTLKLQADRDRIEQVIQNLLSNAIKYGGGNPIEVEIGSETRFALIKIIDHGLGIQKEDLERIFNRFERLVSSREISGLGLGLYIVKKIVEAHGGNISVNSQVGVGSKFTVRLPLAKYA